MDGDNHPESEPSPAQDTPQGGLPPRTRESQHPLIVLADRITNQCRYVYDSQGMDPIDLVQVLHGVMAQVLLWEFLDADRAFDEDLDLDLGLDLDSDPDSDE